MLYSFQNIFIYFITFYSQPPSKALTVTSFYKSEHTGPGRLVKCKGHWVNKWLGGENRVQTLCYLQEKITG